MIRSVGCLLVLCFVLVTVKEAFGQMKPLNAVTESGGEVIFNCSGTVFRPSWFMSKDGSTNPLAIAGACVVTPGLENQYNPDPTGGPFVCNLIVLSVTTEQAGVYWCTDGATPTSFALLTVMDSSTAMAFNNTPDVKEEEHVVFTCSINYNGSVEPAPTLRPYYYWTDDKGRNVSNFVNKVTENKAVSELSVKAEREDIASHTCHVYLDLDPHDTAGYANNTPTVNNSASSPLIAVLYGPDEPKITIKYQIIEIGGIPCEVGVLTCNSTGNPQPSYVWRDTKENSNITTAATFDLAEINRNYTCVAINTIRNEIYEAKAFHVQTSLNNVENCRFPRDESARHDVTGCDNGTCSCSNGYAGINLTCNAESYPNASFQWAGPDETVIYSKVYTNITTNGIYRCTSYFDRSMTNYSGNVVFANGSSEANVSECCAVVDLVMSVVIPFLIKCLILLVVFIVCLNLLKEFRVAMTKRFNWLKKLQHSSVNGHVDLPATKNKTSSGAELALCICFVIGSLAIGLFVIPVLITIAFCSSSVEDDAPDLEMRDNQKQMEEDDKSKSPAMTHQSGAGGTRDSKSKWILVLMWCLTVVALVPVAFIIVFFAFCNQMQYAIV